METYKGIEYLRRKLDAKKYRVNTRYKYYEMKNHVQDFGISTPPKLRALNYSLGWCAKAVDSLADRIVFSEFRDDSGNFSEIASMNNPDIYFDSAILEAMIGSCSFTYISTDTDSFPRWQVITANNATGTIDPITGFLKEGYAVLNRNEYGDAETEAYFLPFVTFIYQGNEVVQTFKHASPYPLLVPHINRPDSKRAFGHSVISRACMDIVSSACRTAKRSEISAEFFAFPQKYAIGTSQDMDIDKWSAAMSAMINISKDEDGDRPVLGQFQQMSQSPHLEQFKLFASAFAGETGLTLDDLGFATENPASAEAIKSQHENLRLKARKSQRTFGSSFINVGIASACVRDNYTYNRKAFYNTKCAWEPIFEPDSAMLSSMGDGIIKLNTASDGFMTEQRIKDMTGIK